MEAPEKENSKNDFLKACEKIIKEYPSKNITGECKNCFLFHVQDDLDNLNNFRSFTKNNYNYNYTDCYRIASFLQDAGLIKIKNGIIANECKTTYIDCDKFSFLNSFGKNKI